jgi:murein L,D-transpeptidase YafK
MLSRPVPLQHAGLLLCLTIAALTGCKSTSKTIQPSTHADHILVIKSEHTLSLLADGKTLKTYKVAMGKGSGAAKRHEGDHETPEGFCTIDSRNAHSRFHRALHISYPNPDDRSRALASAVNPGGQIMIHGIQNGLGWLGSLQRTMDWTDGCIAVTDSEIEEIWDMVPIGTPIEIRH